MNKQKIGPLLLSGMMIGPILGSGIIILPPVAYQTAKSWALPAWLVIITCGFIFAWVFGRLSIRHPGDAGVSDAIKEAFGVRAKRLASYFLAGAALFGPVAVMLTAGEYLFPGEAHPALIALVLLLLSAFLLLQRLAFISRLSLVLSSLAALILFIGSMIIIYNHPIPPLAAEPIAPSQFGYTLLLLFFAIVGWEVIGNYSGEVRNPGKTIMQAVAISSAFIAMVTLSVATAVHGQGAAVSSNGLTIVVAALFKGHASLIMAMLTCALCLTTYLLFVGAVARLLRALALSGDLPAFLARSSKVNVPLAAVGLLTGIHMGVLLLVHVDVLDVEQLLAVADGFFVGNALIGILAAVRLLQGWPIKICAILLAMVFLIILTNAAPMVRVAMAGIALLTLFSGKKFLHRHDAKACHPS